MILSLINFDHYYLYSLTFNFINLTDRVVLREKFPRLGFMIPRAFSFRPDPLYGVFLVDQMTVEFKKGLQFHFHSRFGQSRFRINSFGYIEKKMCI
jgi:hypothetical protein